MILSNTPIYAQNSTTKERVQVISFVPSAHHGLRLTPDAIVITPDNKLEAVDIRDIVIVDSPEQEEQNLRAKQRTEYNHLYEQIAFANDDPNIRERLVYTLRSSFEQGSTEYREAVIRSMQAQVEKYKKAKGNKLNDKK